MRNGITGQVVIFPVAMDLRTGHECIVKLAFIMILQSKLKNAIAMITVKVCTFFN